MSECYLNKRSVKISSIMEFIENHDYHYHYSSVVNGYYSYFNSENQGFLEEYSDGPTPGTYPDQPYLFSSGPNRRFYQRLDEVFSIYECTISVYASYDKTQLWSLYPSNLKETLDYVIILMSKGAFAAGLYKESEHMTPRDEKAFRNRVKAYLEIWDAAELNKFICCRREDFEIFGYNKVKNMYGVVHEKHMHIPFHTGYPTVSEVKRVNERLFSLVNHGNLNKLIRNAKKEMSKRAIPKVASKSPTFHSPQDREAPKIEPLVNPKSIRDFILRDDGLTLKRKLENASANSLSNFLSSFHPETDESPFLHYAVVKDSLITTAVLLNLGANPCQVDKKGKLPYKLCQTEEMRKLFIAKRAEFPERFNWELAKVPTVDKYKKKLRPRIEPTKEFDSRSTRDAVRMKMKEKLDKKNNS